MAICILQSTVFVVFEPESLARIIHAPLAQSMVHAYSGLSVREIDWIQRPLRMSLLVGFFGSEPECW